MSGSGLDLAATNLSHHLPLVPPSTGGRDLLGSPHAHTHTDATPRATRRVKGGPTNATNSTLPRTTTHELWRLHGATDVLRGLAVETSFGYALALELDREIILLHLQPDLDTLVECTSRIERNLIANGWRPSTTPRTAHDTRNATRTPPSSSSPRTRRPRT